MLVTENVSRSCEGDGVEKYYLLVIIRESLANGLNTRNIIGKVVIYPSMQKETNKTILGVKLKWRSDYVDLVYQAAYP